MAIVYSSIPPLSIGIELLRCPPPRCPPISIIELSLLLAFAALSAAGLRAVTLYSGPGTTTCSAGGWVGEKLVLVS